MKKQLTESDIELTIRKAQVKEAEEIMKSAYEYLRQCCLEDSAHWEKERMEKWLEKIKFPIFGE
jgi:hypothetical protein